MHRIAFTVAEANQLIPVLEGVLSAIQSRIESVERTSEKLQVLEVLWGDGLMDPENPDHGEAERIRVAVRDQVAEVEDLVEREIHGRGLRFPQGGLEYGLIDIPTTWEGRWVYLCWRRGEPAVGAWHEIEAGFAGRQSITAEQARVMGQAQESEDGGGARES